MKVSKISLTICLATLSLWSGCDTTGGEVQARGKRDDAFILNQMVLAQRAAAIADEQMWKQMQMVMVELKKLVQTSLGGGTAVSLKKERLDKWSQRLTALRGKNPYLEADVLQSEFKVNGSSALKTGDSTAPVKVVFDSALGEAEAQRLTNNPPSEWRAYPGTITAVIAADGSYIIWAAAIDTYPLRTTPGQTAARTLRGNFLSD